MKKLMPALLVALLAGCAGKAAVEPKAPEAKAEQAFPIAIAWKTAPQGVIKYTDMPDITFTVTDGSVPQGAIDVQVVFDTDIQRPTTRQPGTNIVGTPTGSETSEMNAVRNPARPDMAIGRIRCMQVIHVSGLGEIKGDAFKIPISMFLVSHERPDTNLLYPADVTIPTFRVALFKAQPGVNSGVKRGRQVQLSNWITVQIDPNPYEKR